MWSRSQRFTSWVNGFVSAWRGGGPHQTVLVGMWITAAVLPLTRRRARKLLGRFIWALRPAVGYLPFLAGWWSFCPWGPNWLQKCPLNLLYSLCHCLVQSLQGWNPAPLLPFSLAVKGRIFVDATFDVDRYKIGLWARDLGGEDFSL